jgi:tRNA (uracil-5-)-methyltransferase TRM9
MESVKDVYTSISDSFSKTRVKVWPCVARFLNSVSGKGLEIGCGNGKNMMYRRDLEVLGLDICPNFVKLCQTKGLGVIEGNMTKLPYDTYSFDFVYCIAALHHLETRELRSLAIQEMARVCKPGGLIFILVWAFEQEPDSKHKFETQDVMVPWKDGSITKHRFYHVYKEHELEDEVIESLNLKHLHFEIKESFYEKGNWGILFQN